MRLPGRSGSSRLRSSRMRTKPAGSPRGLRSQRPAASLVAMAGVGFGISVVNVAINMLLQSMAPEALRGRVVSFFSSTRFGFDALGGLVAGLVAAPLGAGTTLLLEGLVLLVFVGFLVTRRHRLKAELATTTA